MIRRNAGYNTATTAYRSPARRDRAPGQQPPFVRRDTRASASASPRPSAVDENNEIHAAYRLPQARPSTSALFFEPNPRQLHSAASTCIAARRSECSPDRTTDPAW